MLEGLPPNDAIFLMRLSCEEAKARSIADIIVESFDPATTAASAFEEKPCAASQGTAAWIAEAYFGAPPDETKVRTLVAIVAGEAAARKAIFGRIEAQDWVKSSFAGLKPVRAGRFVIHGRHERGAAMAGTIAIEIEAAFAFGTGHHGSTQGCVLMLGQLAGKRRPNAILDLGTGSGILAIAAAKSFRRGVYAADIDPVCVTAARLNAGRNDVGNYVRAVRAKGAAHPLLRQKAPYDLIMANILARPLIELAPEIARLASPRANIILSGLIARDCPSVISAYRSHSIFLVRRTSIEGWATLMMRRA
ncbi:MAG: 50S ribosomal protein L11 methyltransferase [Methylocapsa sp.]|nr:50S ribosomal protein L11 methyltransferase [Methylocapsa sp.]